MEIGFLPNEVISIVLSYLPYNYMKAYRCVCKKWYLSSLSPNILKREKLVCDSAKGRNIKELIFVMKNRTYPYHWHLSNYVLDDEFIKLLSENGCVIRSLTLQDCTISETFYQKFLECCWNINKLIIGDDRIWTLKLNSQQSQTLQCLTISTLTISDDTFNKFVKLLPNVESLSLNSSNLCCSELANKRFYKDIYIKENVYNSDSIFSIYSLFNFLSSNMACRIKHLDLSSTKITDENLRIIAETPDLHLEKVVISGCQEIADKGIKSLVHSQRKLKYLDASYCHRLTCTIFNDLHDYLEDLNVLNLNNCVKIKSVDLINFIKNVSSLNTVSCESTASYFDFEQPNNYIHNQRINYNLISLNVRGRNYDFPSIKWILRSFPQLKSINLDVSCISDDVVRYITKSLTCLESLNLMYCASLTQRAFGRIDKHDLIKSNFDHLKYLKYLNLGFNPRLDDSTVHHYLKIPSLKTLYLTNNAQLSCDVFSVMVKNVPNLCHLNLVGTAVDIPTILILVTGFKKLEWLSALGCKAIESSDSDIPNTMKHLADSNKNLQYVEMFGNVYLRNYYTGLFDYVKSARRSILEIN